MGERRSIRIRRTKGALLAKVGRIALFPPLTSPSIASQNGGGLRTKSWSNEELQASLANDTEFKTATIGWIEQRAFLRNSLAALPPTSDLAQEVAQAFDEVDGPKTKLPFEGGALSDVPVASVVCCGDYNVSCVLRWSTLHPVLLTDVTLT